MLIVLVFNLQNRLNYQIKLIVMIYLDLQFNVKSNFALSNFIK